MAIRLLALGAMAQFAILSAIPAEAGIQADARSEANADSDGNAVGPSPFYAHVVEAMPLDVAGRHAAFERRLAAVAARQVPLKYASPYSSVVIRDYKRWAPGSTLTVAFPKISRLTDSERVMREDIERLAQSWIGSDAANLKLSFRRDDGTFREWSPLDRQYSANIRISFSGDGYWSEIGRLSEEPSVIYPGSPSMSLSGFAEARPQNWKRIVLHEFGHALGFAHEHQNANVECGFRFADDPGYVAKLHANGTYIPDDNGRRPGLYTWFLGTPNKWNKPKVDQNIGPIGLTQGYKPIDFVHDDFDRHSIMVYHFEQEFFVRGRSSACFVEESQALSSSDKMAAARAYRINAITDIRLGALKAISESGALSAEIRGRTSKELSILRQIRLRQF